MVQMVRMVRCVAKRRQIMSLAAFSALTGVQFLTPLPSALAQQAGLLYDPEPPADSAYVRVLVVSNDGAVDVVVDGKARAQKLSPGEVSDYLVIGSGKHTIALHSPSKATASASHTFEVVPGKAMTVAFMSAKPGVAPTIFEDKANTNKLKSLVAAYHLDGKSGPLNVLTADGATKVFTNLGFGTSSSIQVNPISVELVAAKSNETSGGLNAGVSASKAKLAMTAGANYSVFLLPNEKGNLTARAVQNKTERYTGK